MRCCVWVLLFEIKLPILSTYHKVCLDVFMQSPFPSPGLQYYNIWHWIDNTYIRLFATHIDYLISHYYFNRTWKLTMVIFTPILASGLDIEKDEGKIVGFLFNCSYSYIYFTQRVYLLNCDGKMWLTCNPTPTPIAVQTL